ncbi:hypothetical protein HDV03_000442, partial [Kappamyces sp. JEL0829]
TWDLVPKMTSKRKHGAEDQPADSGVKDFKKLRVSSPIMQSNGGIAGFRISTRQPAQNGAADSHFGSAMDVQHARAAPAYSADSPFGPATPMTPGQDWDHCYSINQQLGYLVQERRREREQLESLANTERYREINKALAAARNGRHER